MIKRLTVASIVGISLLMTACNSAESDWDGAKIANTLAAYQTFVQKYPNDKHADDARGRILALQDDKDWKTAQNTNTVDSFQEYLKKESGGTHVLEAQARLTSLHRADTWKAADSEGSVAALQAFLQKYPQGPEADHARQKLASLAPYHVELADTHSKASAEHKRAELQARFGNVLHEVVIVPPSAPEKAFRVTSGSMSQADAKSACANLERAHQHCKPVENQGSAG